MDLPVDSMPRRLHVIRWIGLAAIAIGAVASIPQNPTPTTKESCSSCCVLGGPNCSVNPVPMADPELDPNSNKEPAVQTGLPER
jgi:hypothetical protein